MKFRRFLSLAQAESCHRPPDKQHIVVCAAFDGKRFLGLRLNTADRHAEDRALEAYPAATELVTWRFNRADGARTARPSGPCSECCALIRASGVRRIQYLSKLGPTRTSVESLQPYDEARNA